MANSGELFLLGLGLITIEFFDQAWGVSLHISVQMALSWLIP